MLLVDDTNSIGNWDLEMGKNLVLLTFLENSDDNNNNKNIGICLCLTQPHLLIHKMIFTQIFHDVWNWVCTILRGSVKNVSTTVYMREYIYRRKQSDITHVSQRNETANTGCFGAQNSYTDTCKTITQNHFQPCKQALTLATLSCVWGIYPCASVTTGVSPWSQRWCYWLSWGSEGKNTTQAVKFLDVRWLRQTEQLLSLVFGMYLENGSWRHLQHLSDLRALLRHVLWFNEQLLQQRLLVKLTH